MFRAYLRRPIRLGILLILLVLLVLGAFPALAANTARQVPPIQLGTSGGSPEAFSATTCCAGTLGALVSRDGVLYILSNNHVLTRFGATAIGENILQPGMADVHCSAPLANVVATYPGDLVPLGSHNVDTALAKVIPGQVDASGSLLGLGIPCSSTAAPAVGLQVIKAGRATGTTTGTVQAIDVIATVRYQTQCGGGGNTFTQTFTHQVTIAPADFSAGGDSGSLVLTNSDPANRHPLALIFAGNDNVTIANPIADVVAAYQAGGHSFGFVGKRCLGPLVATWEPSQGDPSPARVARARRIKKDHETELLGRQGVIGVGVGRVTDRDDETETAIVVYVEAEGSRLPRGLKLPKEIAGVKVRVIATGPFVAR